MRPDNCASAFGPLILILFTVFVRACCCCCCCSSAASACCSALGSLGCCGESLAVRSSTSSASAAALPALLWRAFLRAPGDRALSAPASDAGGTAGRLAAPPPVPPPPAASMARGLAGEARSIQQPPCADDPEGAGLQGSGKAGGEAELLKARGSQPCDVAARIRSQCSPVQGVAPPRRRGMALREDFLRDSGPLHRCAALRLHVAVIAVRWPVDSMSKCCCAGRPAGGGGGVLHSHHTFRAGTSSWPGKLQQEPACVD